MVKQISVLVGKVGIGSALTNTSGFVNNAVVGQAIDDRRRSWLHRFSFSRKSVKPTDGLLRQKDKPPGKKKLRKFSLRKKSNAVEEGMMKLKQSDSLSLQHTNHWGEIQEFVGADSVYDLYCFLVELTKRHMIRYSVQG